ncbi:MAG: hypothetical protein MUP81_03380 [Dehalococcoidia bacterium]|nr:hypothetical protein [Dehalococcoidia bacterium]
MSALCEHFRKINEYSAAIGEEVKLIQSDRHLPKDSEEFVRITDVEISIEELKRTLYRTQTEQFEVMLKKQNESKEAEK